MIGKGQNKKSMAYVGNIVALIKDRIEKKRIRPSCFLIMQISLIFLWLNLLSILKKKMHIILPKQNIPYWLGYDRWLWILTYYQLFLEKNFL